MKHMFALVCALFLSIFIFSECRNLRTKRQGNIYSKCLKTQSDNIVVSASAGNSSVTGDRNNVTGDLTAAVDTMGKSTVELVVNGWSNSNVTNTSAANAEAVVAMDNSNGNNSAVGSVSTIGGTGANTVTNSTSSAFIGSNETVSHTFRSGEATGIGDVKVESSGQNLVAINGTVLPDSNVISNQEAASTGSFNAVSGVIADQKLNQFGLNSSQVGSAFAQGQNSGSASVNAFLERYSGKKIQTNGVAAGTAGELINSGVNSAIDVNDVQDTFESAVNSFGEAGGQGNSSLLTAAATANENMYAIVNGDANVQLNEGESTVNGSNMVLLNNAGVAAKGTGDATGNGTTHEISLVHGIVANNQFGETEVVGANSLLGVGNQKSEAGASVDTVYNAAAGEAKVDSLGTAKSNGGEATMLIDSNGLYTDGGGSTNYAFAQSVGQSTGDVANTVNHNFIKVDENSASGSTESNSDAHGGTYASAKTDTVLNLEGVFAGNRAMAAGGEAAGSGTDVIANSHSRVDDFAGINNLVSKHSITAGGTGTSSLQLSGYIVNPKRRKRSTAEQPRHQPIVEKFMHVCLTNDPITCGWLVRQYDSVRNTEGLRFITLSDFMKVLYNHAALIQEVVLKNGETASLASGVDRFSL